MAEPTIPYLPPVLVKLIKEAGTDAESRVGSNMRDAQGHITNIPRIPSVMVDYDPAGALAAGQSDPIDQRIELGRVYTECRARNEELAWRLHNQVRDVFLPPAQIVEGYYGTVDAITIFGTRMDMPPRKDLDARNVSRVVCSYLLYYHRETLPPPAP